MKFQKGQVFKSIIPITEVYNEIINVENDMITVSQFGPSFDDIIVRFKKSELVYGLRNGKLHFVNDWTSQR